MNVHVVDVVAEVEDDAAPVLALQQTEDDRMGKVDPGCGLSRIDAEVVQLPFEQAPVDRVEGRAEDRHEAWLDDLDARQQRTGVLAGPLAADPPQV